MVKLWKETFLVLAIASLISCLPMDTSDPRSLIRPNTPENIAKLNTIGKFEYPELYSGQYQGDMVMSDDEIKELEEPSRNSKIHIIASRYQWAGGIVPFRIMESHFTQEQIDYIRLGLRNMEAVTCLRFVAYNPILHNDYVTVTGTSSGCFSQVGRRGTGEQILNLQNIYNGSSGLETGCFWMTTIIHEFMHAIGFYHMQSATERDEYVEIVWDKIEPGTANNFNKYEANVIQTHGVEYDYGSIMHYGPTAFSVDGSPTILPLRDLNGLVMGQRVRMSESDILRMNRAYCDGHVETTTTVPNPNIPNFIQGVNNWVNNLLNNILGGFRP